MTSTIKVNTVQDTDGNNIINENANTITIGASGDTIAIPAGANATLGGAGSTITIPAGSTITNSGTAVNFGATGSASWSTTVKTGDFTAVAGEGYFVDTSSAGGPVTASLPAGSAGAVVAFKDYAGSFDTNKLIIAPNGSDKIGGAAVSKQIATEGIAVTLIFIDSTQGWLVTDDGLQTSVGALSYSVDFLVIAGGGSGGETIGGGGGAGGYRESTQTILPGSGTITVTIGDGGAAQGSSSGGNNGNDSSFSGSG